MARVAPFSDPAKAREAAAKSLASRAANRELQKADPERFFRQVLEGKRQRLITHLIDAVEGRGIFSNEVECSNCGRTVEVPGLPAASRLSALQTALAYSVGRPKAGVSMLDRPKDQETEEPEGFSIE
jgi:hypothetical protein